MALVLSLIRRVLHDAPARLVGRRFVFAFAAVAAIAYKFFHIYSHVNAIPPQDLQRWGCSFFFQDTVFLILLRLLIDGRALACVTAYFLALLSIFLSFLSVTFFVATGSELQWRNLALAGDSSSWSLAAQALFAGALVMMGFLVVAAATQTAFYNMASISWRLISLPFTTIINRIREARGRVTTEYMHVPQKDLEDSSLESAVWKEDAGDRVSPTKVATTYKISQALTILVGVSLFLQLTTTIFRPEDASLSFLSSTILLAPIIEVALSSKPTLAALLSTPGSVHEVLANATALADPIELSWLPKGKSLDGFQDWYVGGREHYSAAADPLKVSNLDDPLLPELRGALSDVSIRNIVLIKLESTRKDVFPVKNNGTAYRKLASTHENKTLPRPAHKFLSSLTPTAKFLTGDYEDGFDSKGAKPQRGGINFNNAFTTSTYTLKSLTGTLCGISPLAVDFNQEYYYDIYQPCLPHILDAFNNMSHASAAKREEGGFTSMPWASQFMMSVTSYYDKQDKLMPKLGFANGSVIDWWFLKDTPKYGPVNLTDVNYYGMPEPAIEDYIRNAFKEGKEKNERVFLSHLTSTTHHGFGIPDDEKNYVPLTEDDDWKDLSHYMNAVGYVDGWLQKVLDILDETGVANETLVVLVGDHGLSIAERGTTTPYGNPHVANYHVPLVISHPNLPPITVDDAVQSIQILPTILDMLIETGSLSQSESGAARDLLRNYEGQSLLRPQRKFSSITGQGSWQFTVMNPGGSTIAVRDARRPSWRLIVPIMSNYEWRFTDLDEDPLEEKPILSFDLKSLTKTLGGENGTDTSKWVEEAAVVSLWWSAENYKRWRYSV